MSGITPANPADASDASDDASDDAAGAIVFPPRAYAEMIAAAYAAYPLEACGLLVGAPADGDEGDERGGDVIVHRFVPCNNESSSAKVYSIPGKELLRAERAADDDGLQIVGVFHSHTHSEPFPSPTDVAQAADPDWRYVIVSLKRESPEARCYLLPVPGTPSYDAGIREVPITVG